VFVKYAVEMASGGIIYVYPELHNNQFRLSKVGRGLYT
jgi:hypothetical protein